MPLGHQQLGEGMLDVRGLHQIQREGMCRVAVIFQHSGIQNVDGTHPGQTVSKLGSSMARLICQRPSSPEVKQDHATAGLHGANGCAVFRDYELLEILVDAAGFRAVGLNGGLCIRELRGQRHGRGGSKARFTMSQSAS